MTNKDYMTVWGSFDNEEAAIADAKKRAFKNGEDVKVYKAYKIVATLTPNVEVKDYVIA